MTGPSAVWAALLWWLVVPAAASCAASASRRRRREWERRWGVAQMAARRVGQQHETLRQDHAALEQTMSRLAGLYELTKRLLVTLDRHDAARGLADALTDAFPRAAFRLVWVQVGERPLIRAVMRLGERGVVDESPTAEEQWLLDGLVRHPTMWSALPSVGVASTVDVATPEALRSATAFPLLADGALQGFLVADQVSPEGIERCGILISQFALAVRRIRLYEQVQELAIRDGLTGVLVRRHFLGRLQEEVARAARHDMSLSFLMVDIDYFKQVNDTHGHLVGDTVLRELAALLRTHVRDVDLLGRYGGEEFGIGLLETDAAQAQLAAERIRHAVAAAVFRAYDERLTITVSIGIAAFPRDAADAAELVERADTAMYRAKASGRNQVVDVAR